MVEMSKIEKAIRMSMSDMLLGEITRRELREIIRDARLHANRPSPQTSDDVDAALESIASEFRDILPKPKVFMSKTNTGVEISQVSISHAARDINMIEVIETHKGTINSTCSLLYNVLFSAGVDPIIE